MNVSDIMWYFKEFTVKQIIKFYLNEKLLNPIGLSLANILPEQVWGPVLLVVK